MFVLAFVLVFVFAFVFVLVFVFVFPILKRTKVAGSLRVPGSRWPSVNLFSIYFFVKPPLLNDSLINPISLQSVLQKARAR